MIKPYKMYTHSSKEDNYYSAVEDHVIDEGNQEALNLFKYALYEVEFDVEVDTETGQVMIHKVNGVPLERPVEG